MDEQSFALRQGESARRTPDSAGNEIWPIHKAADGSPVHRVMPNGLLVGVDTLGPQPEKTGRRPLRILMLIPSLPYPPIWGFGIRVYEFVRLLGQRHHVSLLTYAEPGDSERVKAVAEVCAAVHTIPRVPETKLSKRLTQFSSMFSRASFQRRNGYSRGMQQKLNELMSQEGFDIIQIESSQLTGFTFDHRALRVLDEHNIEYELLYRMYQTESSAMRRVYNRLEFLKFRREEMASWQSVSGVVSTSAREEQIIGAAAPATPTVVVANAVNVKYYHLSQTTDDVAAIVMTGLMRYRPNVDGATYFVREIFPQILASRPNTIFYIVGAGASDELKQLSSANVVVTDTVPDVRPYVHKGAVFVVPLRMGGGTRLKVLEGLSMGKAVVSTSVGCEGIDVVHGEHLLIADEPRAFADAVMKLLDDSEMRLTLGRQGRALVERQYRWETVVERLERFYDRLLVAS